jgi:hypothetical protein
MQSTTRWCLNDGWMLSCTYDRNGGLFGCSAKCSQQPRISKRSQFVRGKTIPSFLQLLGATCLVVVVLTHVSEAVNLFPWMHWGLQHSVGHYLDFCSAVLGLALFPIGFLLGAVTKRRT